MEHRSRYRAFSALFVLSVVWAIATIPVLSAQEKHPRFTPPELLTAADITYPINSGAAGVVVVAARLDDAGKLKGTDVLRDIPSLTAPVLLSVRKWAFSAAKLDGKAVESTMIVCIAFNPANYRLEGTAAPPLGKELEVLPRDANGFLPPKVNDALWAAYPLNSVAQGAVILDANVSRTGRVTHVTPIWAPYLEKPSADAAKKWSFEPADFKGEPIAANAVVGYVYRPPNIAVPVAPFRPTPQ
jgi:Gram-negative bacterial TonB protein C-terminal